MSTLYGASHDPDCDCAICQENDRLGYDADVSDPRQYCRHGTFIGSSWGPDYLCGKCEMGEDEAAYGPEPEPEEEDHDDDPRCVCGVYRSEHALMGCPEGFQTPNQWASEREAIRARVWRGED
jgi:hypothetical protein